MTELKKWYIDNGICCYCGQEKAAKGRQLCLNCADIMSIRSMAYYEANKEELKAKMRDRAHQRYRERKERGECIACGKPAKPGKTRCERCLAKDARRHIETARKQGALPRSMFGDGEHCSMCGKPVDNSKLCPSCYEITLKNIAHARTFVKGGWKSKRFIFGRRLYGED